MSQKNQRTRFFRKYVKIFRHIDSRIFLLWTIKGLKSEEEKVVSAFKFIAPSVVGAYIAESEVEGLDAVVSGDVKEMGLSTLEKAYARQLSSYGEVQVPPPCLVMAYRLSKKAGIPFAGIDMSDNMFADAYTRHITPFQLMRQSIRTKRLKKKKYRSENPRAFAHAWDRNVNRLKGFRELEEARNVEMAQNIVMLARDYARVLAVVECERFSGVEKKLRTLVVQSTPK